MARMRRPRMSINDPVNTVVRDPSTQDRVDYVLEFVPPKWYRRNMAKKKTARISGVSLLKRREALGVSQDFVERVTGIDQQTISRIEREETKGGESKLKYIQFLDGMERSRGLQPKKDDGMTAAGQQETLLIQDRRRATYDLRLFKPLLGQQGGIMMFAA